MRLRCVAVLGVVVAAVAALSMAPQAGASSDTSSTSSTTAETSSTSSTTTSTTTAAVGAPIGAPAGAGGIATRVGNEAQVADTQPPPPADEILPANSGTGRRVVYSNSLMRVWAVEEDGTVAKTHRVSGLDGVPPPGTYSVWSRSLYTYSANNPSIRWMYMVRFAHTVRGGNIGFHEIPTKCDQNGCHKMQTEEELGMSLSGGCVRQSTPDAIWMWEWAQLGTKVVVLP
jgi:lipoprotein-anchoring transpeptidase ErfK/SrfK